MYVDFCANPQLPTVQESHLYSYHSENPELGTKMMFFFPYFQSLRSGLRVVSLLSYLCMQSTGVLSVSDNPCDGIFHCHRKAK